MRSKENELRKLNPKQRLFCLAYVETGEARQSYLAAGYTTKASKQGVSVQASKLLARPNVIAYVNELKAKQAEALTVNVATITAMLYETRADARKAGQHGVAQSCAMGIAKLHGLLIERQEVSGGAELSLTVNYVPAKALAAPANEPLTIDVEPDTKLETPIAPVSVRSSNVA